MARPRGRRGDFTLTAPLSLPFSTATFGGAQSTPAFGQPAQQTSTFGTLMSRAGQSKRSPLTMLCPLGSWKHAHLCSLGGGFGSAAPAAPAFGAPAAATPSFGQPAAGGGLFGAGNTANTGSTGFSFGGTGERDLLCTVSSDTNSDDE